MVALAVLVVCGAPPAMAQQAEQLKQADVDDPRYSICAMIESAARANALPVDFFEAYIQPTFASHRAVVYVLPEIRSLVEVFGLHETMSAKLSRRS